MLLNAEEVLRLLDLYGLIRGLCQDLGCQLPEKVAEKRECRENLGLGK